MTGRPSPIEDVDATSLWMFTLEDDRSPGLTPALAPADTERCVGPAKKPQCCPPYFLTLLDAGKNSNQLGKYASNL